MGKFVPYELIQVSLDISCPEGCSDSPRPVQGETHTCLDPTGQEWGSDPRACTKLQVPLGSCVVTGKTAGHALSLVYMAIGGCQSGLGPVFMCLLRPGLITSMPLKSQPS